MRDIDIRRALHGHLAREHCGQDILVVDELRMCSGEARVDVAVFNARLGGYEIKSERDTLARLPNQLRIYCDVCDFVTLVVNEPHAAKVQELVPAWCGILIAREVAGEVVFSESRLAIQNPEVNPLKRAELLWRSEALSILEARGLLRGCRSKPRYELWKVLAAQVPPEALNADIIATIKARGDWRVDRQRGQCDATLLQ